MRRIVSIVFLAAVVMGCGRDRYLPAGPLAAPSIRFEHAIYLPPSAQASPLIVEQLLRRHSELQRVDKLADKVERMTIAVHVENDVRKDFPPPDPHLLKYVGHGLTAAHVESLQKSTQAIVLAFAHPQKDVWRSLRHATELAAEVARATGGLILDVETREVFTPEEWERRRLAEWTDEIPEVTGHTTIHIYQHGELARAVTLGMAKFGLPDIVMDDFPWSIQRPVGNTINLLSQALAEGTLLGRGGTLDLDIRRIRNASLRDANLTTLEKNGTGVAHLLIIDGDRDDGDPDNRLIEVAFDAYEGNDFHAKREAMLDALFGSTDETTFVDHDDAVLAASRKARENLPALRTAFNAGLAPGELILVKAPFPTDDGRNEWMWVEVSRWEGNSIRGILQNDPSVIRNLHAGQMVEVKESELFDYIRRQPDGSQEGNTTSAFLK